MATYDLPSWLQADAPSEPFRALLAGAQVGSQIASNMRRGQEIREQQRQFDALQSAHKRAEEQLFEERSLQIEKLRLAKDYQLQTDKAEVEIGNLLNTTQPTDPTFRSRLGSIGERYPAVMRSVVWQHAMEMPTQAEKLAIDRLQATNRLPANAADEAAIQAQLAREQAIKDAKTPEEKERAIRAADLGIQKEFKPAMKGTTMRFNDQGVLQQVDVDGGAGPTVATASFVQGNLNTAEKNMQLLNGLSERLRGADLGARGVIGEFVNKTAPQIGLSQYFDPTLASNREALKVTIQGMVRQISSDKGRFSEGDRKRAEAAMVSPGWLENELNARAVLDELRDIVRNRSRVDAETLGVPVPEWALSWDDIIKAVRSGKMTREKGTELRLKHHRDRVLPQ